MVTILENFYRNKKILVTGHTGFKGSWLSLWLQGMGSDVIGYSLRPPTTPSLFNIVDVERNMVSIIGDIRDYQKLKNVFEEYKPEIVFHLAAQALVLESYNNPIETFETNIMGTANVLEAARCVGKVRSLVNVTSDKCYDNKDDLKSYSEEDRLGGIDPYSSSKASAELVIKSYRKSFFDSDESLKNSFISSVRAGNVIGGGDWAEYRLVPDCVRAIENSKKIRLRNPDSTRPWQHVLEPLNGYLQLAQKMYEYGEDYEGPWNFGPHPESVKTVYWVTEKICELWGVPADSVIEVLGGSFKESLNLSLNSSKSHKKLGWKPKLDIEFGLKLTIDWYRTYFQNPKDSRNKTIEQIRDFNG